MKLLITDNGHVHYDRIGEITGRDGDTYRVGIPHRDGSIQTSVKEGQFKIVKRQTTKGIEFDGGPPEHGRYKVDPPGTLSESGRYQADGLGCVEKVSGVERDWDGPRY